MRAFEIFVAPCSPTRSSTLWARINHLPDVNRINRYFVIQFYRSGEGILASDKFHACRSASPVQVSTLVSVIMQTLHYSLRNLIVIAIARRYMIADNVKFMKENPVVAIVGEQRFITSTLHVSKL